MGEICKRSFCYTRWLYREREDNCEGTPEWDARIDRFKALHGWEDGRCQNLSGLEGDLNEPDVTIKMMLEEIQEDEARKEALHADAKQTEANEVSVIIQGYSNSAKKKKRPFKQVGDSADTSFVNAKVLKYSLPPNLFLIASRD